MLVPLRSVCTKLHLPNQRYKLIIAVRNSVDIFLLDAMLLLHTFGRVFLKFVNRNPC